MTDWEEKAAIIEEEINDLATEIVEEINVLFEILHHFHFLSESGEQTEFKLDLERKIFTEL